MGEVQATSFMQSLSLQSLSFLMIVFLLIGVLLISAKSSVMLKRFATLLLVTNGLLLTSYLVANRLTGNGIDDSVLYHIMMGIGGAGYQQFIAEILIGLCGVIGSLVIGFYWSSICELLQPTQVRPRTSLVGCGFVLLLVATFINPAFLNVAQLFPSFFSHKVNHSRPEAFVVGSASELPSNQRPKNILYVYLESVERTYFDEALFPGLVPNLKLLEAQAVSFTNIDQPIATGWTIAGMVASQCGMPLLTSREGNSMGGFKQFLPEVNCLGDELQRQNYDLHYMGGAQVSFGGKRSFYDTHGFDSIDGLKTLEASLVDSTYRNGWGLYDDSLLPMVVQRFSSLHNKQLNDKQPNEKQEPFGLFTLTLDTHGPDGYVSRSCRDELYGDGSDPILNSVHCTDKLLGEFVEQIMAIDSDNTLIVISSDHLALPNTAMSRLERGSRKNLFMVLNSSHEPIILDHAGTIFDVGPTLLHFLGFEDFKLGFGRDLLSGSTGSIGVVEVNQLIDESRRYFYGLWSFPDLAEGIEVQVSGYKLRFADDKVIDFPVLMLLEQPLEVENLYFQATLTKTLLSIARGLDPSQDFLWVDECRNVNWLALDYSGQLSLQAAAQEDALWCLAYGSLASESFQITPLPENVAITRQEMQSFFEDNDKHYVNVLSRLDRLQGLIAEKHLPAY